MKDSVFCNKLGDERMFKNMIANFKRYKFLMMQMISRDFKIKYKRSVLGLLWSLLNPILMTAVMYVVFKYMFVNRGNSPLTENFLLYLMIGQIMFAYFSEATNMGMVSVVYNFHLMTKVYLPKYIFPLSKCIFVLINFGMSLIPLFFLAIFTGAPFTWNYLLLPVFFVCLFLFSVGVALALSAIAVFLRDMFHLYSIILLVWNYWTPIFWDITMIPEHVRWLFQLNPIYHMITGVREIMILGITPSALRIGYSIGTAIVVLIIGMFIFKKKQDEFIYYV